MAKSTTKAKKSVDAEEAVEDSIYEEKPSLRIDEDDLPAIKSWSIDKEYTLTLKVKMSQVGRQEYSKNPKVWATFRVEEVHADEDDPFIKGFDKKK